MNRKRLPALLIIPGLIAWALAGSPEPARGEPGKMDAKLKRALAAARMIDARIDRAIHKVDMEPAPQAENEAIVRRLSLDITGRIPTPETVSNYLRSKREDKLTRYIDHLLASDGFNEHWADVLQSAWVGRKRRRMSGSFRTWLREQLEKRRPFDELVRDVIAAEGRLDKNGATYFTFRWDTSPTNVAAQSARVFMGLQIQCAQCHDHPFTEWKQEQFHQFAAYFTNIRRQNIREGDQRIPKLSQPGGGRYTYKLKSGEERSFKAKFLFEFEGEAEGNRRKAVAQLMTHPENPYFARMAVNRIWKSMFGRGLVEPVEDLEANEGYHPMLLTFLGQEFIASGYDLRHLVRTIAHSRAYRRGSVRARGQNDPAKDYERLKDSKDEEKRELAALAAQQEVWLFARASLRPLTPEQIISSLLTATGLHPDQLSYNDDGAAESGKKPQWDKKKLERYNNMRRQLIRQFDQHYGEAGQANPDAFDGTIPQSLVMLNGKFVNEAIKPNVGTMMSRILKETKKPKDVVTYLFLAVLSRRPTSTESRAFTKYLQAQGATTQTYEDLMWALINSSEFVMNH